MAGYGGYFLKGLSSGMQSGLNMGQQIQEMQWQKAQRKKLETKQAEYEEGMAIIGGTMKQLGADGNYSEDDEMKIMTSFYAMIPEVQAVYQDAVNAIQTMNKSKFEADMNWLSLTKEKIEGMDWTDAQGIFDITEGEITTEKGKNYFEAYRNMAEKKANIVQKPKPEDIWGQAGTLPQDVRPDYLRSKGIDIPKSAAAPAKQTDTQVKLAEVDKLTFLTEERRNAMKVNILSGSDSATVEKVNAIKSAGGTDADVLESLGAGVQGVNPPKPTPDTGGLNTAEYNLKQKIINEALVTDSIEEKNAKLSKAEKDLGFKIELSDEEWTQAKKADIDALVQVLDEITAGTPDNRNVKGNVEYTFNLDMGDGPEEVTKTGEEWYELVLESYNALIKILEEQGIDVSQYKLLKPLSEIKKANKWTSGFVGSGVTAGDLIKIYY